MAPLVPGLLLWLFHTCGKATKAERQTKPVSTNRVHSNRLSFGFYIQVMDHQAKQRRIHFILARGTCGVRELRWYRCLSWFVKVRGAGLSLIGLAGPM